MTESRLLDLCKANERWRFTWSDQDWQTALDEVKNKFRPHERQYDPATKTWSVLATGRNEEMLCSIFPNARQVFQELKAS